MYTVAPCWTTVWNFQGPVGAAKPANVTLKAKPLSAHPVRLIALTEMVCAWAARPHKASKLPSAQVRPQALREPD